MIKKSAVNKHISKIPTNDLLQELKRRYCKEMAILDYIRRWIKAMINLKLLRLNPRAYCTKCWKEYTFEEWSKLPSYQTYPQYISRTKYCPDCKGEKFRWLG